MRLFAIFTMSPLLAVPLAAQAAYEPNDNYSTLVVSYQRTNFSSPICIGTDCHEGVVGPSAVYASQVLPNLALGLSGSYLQSSGRSSTIKSTSASAFAQVLAGLGRKFDVGASFSVLGNSLQLCNTLTAVCVTADDYGNDIGVFGKFFFNDTRSFSLMLSHDTLLLHNAPNQSVAALSLVAIIARQHRFRLTFDRVYDSSGNPVSDGASLGYSFVVF